MRRSRCLSRCALSRLENFIFDSDSPDANLKLIDFGLSKKYGNGIKRMQTLVGTPYYMAPEVPIPTACAARVQHMLTCRCVHAWQVVADAGAYTQACDVWGIGVITYMLLSGTPPFKGDTDSAVLQAVRPFDDACPACCGVF